MTARCGHPNHYCILYPMRIGILTLPLHTNYGGILQAYALQTVLERMGHEVCLIEKKREVIPFSLWKAPLVYGKRILMNAFGHPVPIFYEQKANIIKKNTERFIDKYIKRRIVGAFSEIREKDFDAIVVGSDQIWRPKYFKDIEHAYLDFTKDWNIKRIAYAVSFGTDEWEYTPEQSERCGKMSNHFNAVSVREDSGMNLCHTHFGIKAQHVLDPTMLLNKEDYIRLFENANTPKCEGTLLNYILDETPEKLALIEKIAKEKNLVSFRVNSKVESREIPLQERIQPPVEQWLRGFYDAEFVVTDSFHACVFSILFNKPFIAIGNVRRGMSRFKSLLSMFGLEKRLITSSSCDIEEIEDINWSKVNAILNDKAYASIKLLAANLK